MWNVTVRMLGLQGVSEGRRRRVLFLSPCDGGGFSEVPFLPGMGEARAVGSHLTESPDEVSDFFLLFQLLHGWGSSIEREKFSQNHSWVAVVGGGGGDFLPPHPGRSGYRASRRQSRVIENMTETHD